MEIKREVRINGGGVAVARRITCGGDFTAPLANPVKVLRVGRWSIVGALPARILGRPNEWETATFLALWACGLLSIALCLM